MDEIEPTQHKDLQELLQYTSVYTIYQVFNRLGTVTEIHELENTFISLNE